MIRAFLNISRSFFLENQTSIQKPALVINIIATTNPIWVINVDDGENPKSAIGRIITSTQMANGLSIISIDIFVPSGAASSVPYKTGIKEFL